MTDAPKITPMMAQWFNCKEQVGSHLLLFRLGDFYEAFGDDAIKISQILELTLTRRQQVPMCGIPWHTSENYIDRLLSKGYSVAIADQMTSTDESSKGLMERKVTRVLTPATAMKGSFIQESSHSILASLSKRGSRWGIALVDVTTALFQVLEIADDEAFIQELLRLKPKELLCDKELMAQEQKIFAKLTQELDVKVVTGLSWAFEERSATVVLKNHFRVATVDGLGIGDSPAIISAAGAVLVHLKDTLLVPIHHLSQVEVLTTSSFMRLDSSTLVNLDIFESTSRAKEAKSLYNILNQTLTPMGARLLRNWLLHPLLDIPLIEQRQQAIEDSCSFLRQDPRTLLFEALASIRDLERLILRIQTGNAGPRDILFLSQCCSHIEPIQQSVQSLSCLQISQKLLQTPPLNDLINRIQSTLVEEPPHRVTDGNLIRPGVDPQLDELRTIQQSGQGWLVDYQTKLRDELGIKSLRVGYTRAFGYYIEVTRGQADKMPASFTRRQTLTGTERFISQELKQYEDKVFTAEKRIEVLETALFESLKDAVILRASDISEAAKCLGELDLILALAKLADRQNYVRPHVVKESILEIEGGRHPIAEQQLTTFIPNDLHVSSTAPSLLLITGPNMAGKSTYVRQAALIAIMAHIGSFVPAKQATVGLVDQVLSRVGASDDLSRGQSTFMVEMAETASILHRATSRSLILLDEIGRGTSTYDGISIAWAVAEHLTKGSHENPRVLFATHYHEMTTLEEQRRSIRNLTVAISEQADEIKFLYTVIPGKADKSYGIHVAKLAGLPASIVERAKTLLSQLEKKQTSLPAATPFQPELFTLSHPPSQACYDFLKGLDLVKMTPLDCFAKLLAFQQSTLANEKR